MTYDEQEPSKQGREAEEPAQSAQVEELSDAEEPFKAEVEEVD